MKPEFVQLTKSVRLRSDGRTTVKPPVWKDLPLRRRLGQLRVITTSFFAFAVVISAIAIVQSTHPYWHGHVTVPATVTSRHFYSTRGAHCDLNVSFTLASQLHTATYDPATDSTELPIPGSAVVVSVSPADPSRVVIVGLDGYRRSLDVLYFFVFAVFPSFAG
ncbi:hypothetical protein [Arthrobacter sp. ERGS1:01]|uniref:hypothetical protein n=1 Tax=Arthrobacter sp. ERGS1:01 TaxID=1704044 RepID=UPI000A42EC00|nr:hypothetical protein [Arthrobacter sp. ERGS1:01]